MVLNMASELSESIETYKHPLVNVPKIKMYKRPLNQLERHVIQVR